MQNNARPRAVVRGLDCAQKLSTDTKSLTIDRHATCTKDPHVGQMGVDMELFARRKDCAGEPLECGRVGANMGTVRLSGLRRAMENC